MASKAEQTATLQYVGFWVSYQVIESVLTRSYQLPPVQHTMGEPWYVSPLTTRMLLPSYPLNRSLPALLYYDYILTLPSEIKYIWRSKFRLSTVLYILCRYALVANVIYLLSISHHLGKGDRVNSTILVSDDQRLTSVLHQFGSHFAAQCENHVSFDPLLDAMLGTRFWGC